MRSNKSGYRALQTDAVRRPIWISPNRYSASHFGRDLHIVYVSMSHFGRDLHIVYASVPHFGRDLHIAYTTLPMEILN
jgi:hypothetical protein